MAWFRKNKKYFTDDELALIRKAIVAAESGTTGEIRVLVERTTNGYDVLDRAAWHFEKLEMHKTKHRNGVLIYLAMEEKLFAVAGDAGIHACVPEDFWMELKHSMIDYFRDGNICEGIIYAIESAGEELGKHFPGDKDNVNELPDDVLIR